MVRANDDPGSVFVDLLATKNRGVQMIVRDDDYSDAVIVGSQPGIEAPVWLKLTRAADLFTGACSKDGITWTTIATHVTHLPAAAHVGLVVSSADQYEPGTATFDDVAATGDVAAK